jgi:O-antigen/teichoic acid export membrane protein
MSKGAYSVHRFRRALLQYAGGRLAQAAARVALVLVLVRILPIADYGAYMLIFGTAELLLQVGSFGILPLAQRYLPQMLTTLPIRKLYGFVAFLIAAQIALLGGIAFTLWLFWLSLGPVFGMSPELAAATSFAAWLFVIIPAFRFSVEMLEALLAPGQFARALMVFLRLTALLLLLAFTPEVGLTDVLLVDILATGSCVLLVWYAIMRSLASLHSPTADGALPVREMARFARDMALVGPMSATASPGAMRLVLANALGLAESGLYAFLQTLERLVSRYLPATLLRNLIRPILVSRFVGEGNTRLIQAGTGLLLKSNLLAVIGGLVVIAVCGDELVAAMSGGKFVGAGLTLLLLYVNMIATSQRGVQEMVMQLTGHTRALWITTVISPLALVVVWLFAGYGLNVAVLIVTAGSITANALAAGVLRVKTDWFRIDWRGSLAIALPGLGAAAIGIALLERLHPFIAAGVALASFVLLLRLGRPFRSSEMGIVERVVGRRAVRVVRGFSVGDADWGVASAPVGRVVLSLQGTRVGAAVLKPGRFAIGRAIDNDLQIASRFVSRHHAQLITSDEGTVLEDLASTNGVYLNGKRARRHRLVPGDVVRIGMHELTYYRIGQAVPDDVPRHAAGETVWGTP